ncbi:winged helix-turn-helix domain-containing protein [Sphingomonas sp. MS122]|uniref:winged helix-turn-helix domain-containing protein n=1 Tax=Sphingomonas sp. MS122 TaxID=3412683 RepID=UPI003C2D10BD
MSSASYRFEGFHLDPANRRLTRDGEAIELNARYLDALTLLVREPGQLVSKDSFMAEVWRGVPVTDEALTQCIRTLRRQLGDDAASPRFIETVPKHGYRFIAAVEGDAVPAPPPPPAPDARFSRRDDAALTAGFGIVGGSIAGTIGGLIYGFAGASQPLQASMGAASVMLVLLCVTILIGTIGAAAVSIGIAAANLLSARPWRWSMVGGAAGGLVIGAIGKLVGLDAFTLLLGQSPGDITGAAEGTLLGGGVGLGAWLAHRVPAPSPRRGLALGALAGGAAGLAASLLGGRLLAGSLALLAMHFPNSRLRLDQIGALFGEGSFGPVSHAITAAFEGALFGGCMVAAMILARRERGDGGNS